MVFSPLGYFVGGRNLRPNALATDTGETGRLKQTAEIDVSAIQAHFVGWYTNVAGVGDVDCPNSYTVNECYLEHNGVLTPILFAGGSVSVSVAPGTVEAGSCTKEIDINDEYFIRSYITPDTPGGSYPKLYAVADFPGELHQKGANHANEVGTTNLTQYGDVCGPVAVTGTQTSDIRRAVVGIGDSILNGIADTFANSNEVGWFYRWLDGNLPFAYFAISGEQAAEYLLTSARRAEFVGPGAQYAVCTYGINDLQGGRTLAQVQTSLIAIWIAIKALNPFVRVLQTTCTPKSSSIDGWATLVNQTVDFTVEADRPALNAWLRAGAPMMGGVQVAVGTVGAILAGHSSHPLFDILDVASLVESGTTGKWQVLYTGDGVHPSPLGHIAIATGLSLDQLPHVEEEIPLMGLDSTCDRARAAMLALLGYTEPRRETNVDLMRLVLLDGGQTLITKTEATAAVHLWRYLKIVRDAA